MRSGIQILNLFTIPSQDIEITSCLSGGKGGQHVNKTNTKVTLRWNVVHSVVLNDQQRSLLMNNLKLTQQGELVIHADTHRSQHLNIEMIYQKCKTIVEQALYIPKRRKKTKPTRASKERRRIEKEHHSERKRNRQKPDF